MNGASQGRPPLPGGKTSYLPSRKVGAGALAGALSVVLVWIINTFVLTGAVKITGSGFGDDYHPHILGRLLCARAHLSQARTTR